MVNANDISEKNDDEYKPAHKGVRTENHEQESQQRWTSSQHSQWGGPDILIAHMHTTQ